MSKLTTNWVTESGKYEPSERAHGMVYLVSNETTGQFYVGKKQLFRMAPLGKKELAKLGKLDGRRLYKKRIETDWRKYQTSSDEVKKQIARGDKMLFVVLWECADETALKFTELEEIFHFWAFYDPLGLNDNIQIKQIGKIKDLGARRWRSI